MANPRSEAEDMHIWRKCFWFNNFFLQFWIRYQKVGVSILKWHAHFNAESERKSQKPKLLLHPTYPSTWKAKNSSKFISVAMYPIACFRFNVSFNYEYSSSINLSGYCGLVLSDLISGKKEPVWVQVLVMVRVLSLWNDLFSRA